MNWIRIIFYALAGLFFFRAAVIMATNAIAQRSFKQITGRRYTGDQQVSPIAPILFGIGALLTAMAIGGQP